MNDPLWGEERMCPECGAILKLRENRTTGSQFYGCATFPTCLYAEPLESDRTQEEENQSFLSSL